MACDCSECTTLIARYDHIEKLYESAMDTLTSRRADTTVSEYQRLRSLAENARLQADTAHRELEVHRREHRKTGNERLAGKRFTLRTATIAIGLNEGERVIVRMPAGSIVKVLSGPQSDDDRMVNVLWDEQVVSVFSIDLIERGARVRATGEA